MQNNKNLDTRGCNCHWIRTTFRCCSLYLLFSFKLFAYLRLCAFSLVIWILLLFYIDLHNNETHLQTKSQKIESKWPNKRKKVMKIIYKLLNWDYKSHTRTEKFVHMNCVECLLNPFPEIWRKHLSLLLVMLFVCLRFCRRFVHFRVQLLVVENSVGAFCGVLHRRLSHSVGVCLRILPHLTFCTISFLRGVYSISLRLMFLVTFLSFSS